MNIWVSRLTALGFGVLIFEIIMLTYGAVVVAGG